VDGVTERRRQPAIKLCLVNPVCGGDAVGAAYRQVEREHRKDGGSKQRGLKQFWHGWRLLSRERKLRASTINMMAR
jgi:hypothetical protein